MRLISMVAACAALLVSAGAAHAQAGMSTGTADIPNSSGVAFTPGRLGLVATTPSRLDSTRREANRGRTNPRNVEALPTEQGAIMDGAQRAMDNSDVSCDVTEAQVVGRAGENMPIFETVCSNGTGFLVVAEAYAAPVDCALLADGVDDRRNDFEMVTVSECTLPGNGMTVERISTYARTAGVDCNIDRADQIGRTNAGAVFEIACADGRGYWVRQSSNVWSRENCLKVTALNDTCRFTTVAQNTAAFDAGLRGTPAANCGIAQVGYIGQAGSDEVYEVQCRSGGGYILKLDGAERVREAVSCAEALVVIGAACRLS